MNRPLLIIICDFLLLSLLSLARFDTAEPAPETQPRTEAPVPRADEDVMDVLKVALEEERQSREELLSELARKEQNLRAQQALLADRESRIEVTEATLRDREEQARRLAAERAALEEQTKRLDQEKAGLQQRFAATLSNVVDLKEQLASTRNQAQLSREQLDALQADLLKREEEAKRAQQLLAEVEKREQSAQMEKQQLAGQLQLAETEKRFTREQLAHLQTEVQTVRQEKAQILAKTDRLAEGVTELAGKSEELVTEIRQHRPLPANHIFHEFVTNRVRTYFEATRQGLFNREVSRDKHAQTVLVSNGSDIFALCHIQDTPLNLESPGPDWQSLIGFLSRGPTFLPMTQIAFSSQDPRILMVPVTAEQAKRIGTKVYSITGDPFRFEEAVLVGASEGYYGEARFKIDLEMKNYVRMDRSMFRGIVGKFNPSRGDLVFSKTGELLGIMVNHEYCAVIDRFAPTRAITLGSDVTRQQTSAVLSQLRTRIERLPFKLQ